MWRLVAGLVFMVCLWQVESTIDEVIKAAMTPDEVSGYALGGTLDNDGELANLMELDILVDPEEYAQLQSGGITKRKATNVEARRWTNGVIPYKFVDNGFSAEEKQKVIEATKIWNRETCLHFRPATSRDKNYLAIKNGKGCNSYVGMYSHMRDQTVNLGKGCKSTDTALHEFGHAIGLNHEQTRPDRDDHVWVRLDHMDKDKQSNSIKKDPRWVDDYGVPYDYQSIMHYGQTAFTKDGEPTMITRDPSWQFRIGAAKDLSFGDIKTVNLMYKCAEKNNCRKRSCPGGGFQDKNCKCVSPSQYKPVWPCENKSSSCSWFVKQGYCDPSSQYNSYMMGNCLAACGGCGKGCADSGSNCAGRARRGECKSNPVQMFGECKKSCGVCYGTGNEGRCVDSSGKCQAWAGEDRKCITDKHSMQDLCQRSCAYC